MKIGIIGIGSLSMELAQRAVAEGIEVILHNPRGNNLIKEAVCKMGSAAKLGLLTEASNTDIIILFAAKDDLEKIIADMPDMTGKIIIHTSGLLFNPKTLLSGIYSSFTYPITASLLPKAHVVKLFNPVKITAANTADNKNKDEVFLIADHHPSKISVMTFLKRLHFSPVNLSGLKLQNTFLHLQNENHLPHLRKN
ncbi:NAD(P)-binding domain-containing protein [Flavobacterium gelatinilyticum]|uniref:NAD(P)-binding domain-containing protein n=1 Tax=Flavobacterium gelatinilyticum TaxID=3003260 RepID=UPI0024807792|nr:NAD(P)-binding domain-containing protein [Flavobacterium gelatinilyticum]